MQLTSEFGTDWWNDSNDHSELQHAVNEGAVGATSNPVITKASVAAHPDVWLPVIDRLIEENPTSTEDEIAWLLGDQVGERAAKILEPVYEKTNGQKGKLSLQVNPKYYRNADRMVTQAAQLARIAPNIAIKCPVVTAGIKAIEDLTAKGISINATVSFSVPQAVAAAEAVERGLRKAEESGINTDSITPYITIMVGRIDDHLRREIGREKIMVDPGVTHWAGVAIFKKAYRIFKERGYRGKLLSAAFRCHMHWSEFIGGDVIISIPYYWWNQFNASSIEVIPRMDQEVPSEILSQLEDNFEDFRRAYDEKGLTIEEFVRFDSSVNTLNGFLQGYDEFVAIVRKQMVK
ncbi:MAG: transaldolase [Candidatus Marinimicrobia bacterium]|nr:transaldolase [Candidatus Neomarinimicrobiota bacterium]